MKHSTNFSFIWCVCVCSYVGGSKELESVKQLWEKQLRELQAQTSPTESKSGPKATKKPSPAATRGPTSTKGAQLTTKASNTQTKSTMKAQMSSSPNKPNLREPSSRMQNGSSGKSSGGGKMREKNSAERVVPATMTRRSALSARSQTRENGGGSSKGEKLRRGRVQESGEGRRGVGVDVSVREGKGGEGVGGVGGGKVEGGGREEQGRGRVGGGGGEGGSSGGGGRRGGSEGEKVMTLGDGERADVESELLRAKKTTYFKVCERGRERETGVYLNPS